MVNLFVDGYQGLCSRCCNNVKKVLINFRLNNPTFNLQNLKLINFNDPILKQQSSNFSKPLAIFYCNKIICGLFNKNYPHNITNKINKPSNFFHHHANNEITKIQRDPLLRTTLPKLSLSFSPKLNNINFNAKLLPTKKQYKKWIVI